VALSSGSACTSALLEPSYILRTIGAEEDLAYSSIRFGIGRFTTEAEVDYTAQKCILQVTKLREMRYIPTGFGIPRQKVYFTSAKNVNLCYFSFFLLCLFLAK
jgi:hypothetical protein